MRRASDLRLRAAAIAAALFAAVCVVVVGPAVRAADPWPSEAKQRPARYRIDTTLTTIEGEDHPRLLKGYEEILWTNTSRDKVDVLYFHLYANAFEGERSAFLRERARDGRSLPDDMEWGGCDVQSVRIADAPGRQPVSEFVPFEDAPGDRTVLRVRLPAAIEPEASVTLQVFFTTTLPTPVARMGAAKDFVMAAQWYPKLGRYLGRDSKVPHVVEGWYCPHYHAATEFAADFADYEVKLVTPRGWTVGATGTPVADAEAADAAAGTETRTWTARSVVDFAWTAGARFHSEVRTVDPDDPAAGGVVAERVRLDKAVQALGGDDADLPAVEVVLLLQPEHLDQRDRFFDAARTALALFGTWLGPYPYPRLTIVDPPHGLPVGGMEYPTLVTTGTSIGSPLEARFPEWVTVHEIGHQWFMNLLASNEAEEAWLDEGMNSWFTARAMDVAWNPPAVDARDEHGPALDTTVLGLHLDTELPYTFPGLDAGWPDTLGLPSWAHPPDLEVFRLWRDGPMLLATTGRRYQGRDYALPARRSFLRSGGWWDPMVRAGWEQESLGSYRGNAYPRGVLLLESVRRIVRDRALRAATAAGTDAGAALEGADRRIDRAFRAYARRWRFDHPTTADLLKTLRAELDMPDLQQTFDALAGSTGLLDYSVDPPRIVEEPPPPGSPEPPAVVSEVVVRRRGDIVVPVRVRITVHDAPDPSDLLWDGAGRWHRYRVAGRVKSVAVDPDRLFLQDALLSDNVWRDRSTVQPGVKWGVHSLLWLENALTSWGRFF